MSKKAIIAIVAAGVLLLGGGGYLVWKLGSNLAQSDAVVDKVLAKLADQTNRTCPLQIDEITSFDRIEAIPGRTLKYFYTVDCERDSLDVELFRENMIPVLLQNIQENKELKYLKNNSITFVHQYRDRHRETIAVFEFPPESYKE